MHGFNILSNITFFKNERIVTEAGFYGTNIQQPVAGITNPLLNQKLISGLCTNE